MPKSKQPQFISRDERARLFGAEVMVKRADGEIEKQPISVLDGKYIGVYFCRHDSPPSRKFTPRLKEAYAALKAADKPFEILLIISDKQLYLLYQQDHPWTAVTGPASHRAHLCKTFNVASVPALVIISPEGEVIAPNARQALLENPKAFPWEGSTDPYVSYWDGVQNLSAVVVILLAIAVLILLHTYFTDQRMDNAPRPAAETVLEQAVTDIISGHVVGGAATGAIPAVDLGQVLGDSEVSGAGLDGEL